jgi:hypothetical protein
MAIQDIFAWFSFTKILGKSFFLAPVSIDLAVEKRFTLMAEPVKKAATKATRT